LCSPEHGKLCFEHLETISDAQNDLPWLGLKIPSEVRYLLILKFEIDDGE